MQKNRLHWRENLFSAYINLALWKSKRKFELVFSYVVTSLRSIWHKRICILLEDDFIVVFIILGDYCVGALKSFISKSEQVSGYNH